MFAIFYTIWLSYFDCIETCQMFPVYKYWGCFMFLIFDVFVSLFLFLFDVLGLLFETMISTLDTLHSRVPYFENLFSVWITIVLASIIYFVYRKWCDSRVLEKEKEH